MITIYCITNCNWGMVRYSCCTSSGRDLNLFLQKRVRGQLKMSDFPQNCARYVVYGGVRTINGNIRTFTNNIRRKFRKFCVRWSNLCGSRAKMRETHAKCVRSALALTLTRYRPDCNWYVSVVLCLHCLLLLYTALVYTNRSLAALLLLLICLPAAANFYIVVSQE